MTPQHSDLHEARVLLAEMVNQHCSDREARSLIMDSAISTNRDAIAYLEKIGWLELVEIKALRWRWTEKAHKPAF